MTDLLFDIPTGESPRLKWMKRHGVKTEGPPPTGDPIWIAWLSSQGEDWNDVLGKFGDGAFGFGMNEDDAICDLAKGKEIKLWNEEPSK